MPAAIVELDLLARDTGDETAAFESFEPVASWIELAGLAERRAEVADEKPSRDAVRRLLHVVDRVVGVLQIGAVQHQQHDEHAAELARGEKGVVGPLPQFARRQRRQLRPEARLALAPRLLRPGRGPGRQVIDRRLVIAESPQDARHDNLGLRLGADLGAPAHAVGTLDVVAHAETAVVARFHVERR